ncbi:hypothetical protein RN001_002278 [Aquatica leii]|uniref:Tyr recombinase domain-containing protein n=1 Tax=Aquatica leii TaxID=1421715 RepID=A0AAN7SK21_9COLE|nr:hypothetical protein RN001_002278 [Aquatica leii]
MVIIKPLPNYSRPSTFSFQETTPIVEEPFVNGRTFICKALIRNNIPQESTNIFLSSITDSTCNQYESALRDWCLFCKSSSADPYKNDKKLVLQFLTHKFNNGLSYNSLNSIRSALSLALGPQLGQNSDIKRFFRGIYKLKPNRPKYDVTWDPQVVLNYISSLDVNKNLTLETLTKKLITLLALSTAQRMQIFALIKRSNIYVKTNGIEIKIPDAIKTSGPNKFQPLLFLPWFKDKEKLCAATTTIDYLHQTKNLQGAKECLFISFKKPHQKVTTQTLSRWTKEILAKSGINTQEFTAHSTRHASTSAAFKNNINIETIRRTAGWAKASMTFAKFYNKPIIKKYSFTMGVIT